MIIHLSVCSWCLFLAFHIFVLFVLVRNKKLELVCCGFAPSFWRILVSLFSLFSRRLRSPPAKTRGPSQTLRQQEGLRCPLGNSQSCCCPAVRPPDGGKQDVNAVICVLSARRDTEGHPPWAWTESLWFPGGDRPSWSPQTTWGTRTCCHDYRLISYRRAKSHEKHLHSLTCVSVCLSLHSSDFPASLKGCPWENTGDKNDYEDKTAPCCTLSGRFRRTENLQSRLMRLAALLVIFLGNSIMSMPLRMML